MAYEYILGNAPAVPTAPVVSTDREYLSQRLTTYEGAWLGGWPVERIRKHRDNHEAGRVWQGKRLARVFRRDANVVAALGQRTAPWLGCQAKLTGGDDDLRAELTPKIGPAGPLFAADVHRDVAEDLAMCGIAILHHPWKPRADGSRWEPQVEVWDLEAVDFDTYHNCYYTWTRERGRVRIFHGDGLWTIIRRNQLKPHEHGAVIPLAIHVASNMSTIVDRNSSSRAVGMPKIIGTLPPGVKVSDDVGQALEVALDNIMQGLAKLVVANGTDIDKIEFSAAGLGQFFESTLKLDRTAVFMALTGQDGSAQNQGGNYQKAQVLEAVLYSWIVADTVAGATGLTTGLLRPYAEINRGDADLAPSLSWPLPDPDADARIKSRGEREKLLTEIVEARRKVGFMVTQEDVDALAAELDVIAPKLAAVGTRKELFAYDVTSGSFTRNEHRENRGYGPLEGANAARGDELIVPPGAAPAEESVSS